MIWSSFGRRLAAIASLDALKTLLGITGTVTVDNSNWSGTDLAVDNGGTGRSSHTAYAVICGGTTATGAQQSIAGLGSTGNVLTSNGAGALPTFQAAAATGGWTQIGGTTATTSGTTVAITSIPSGYRRLVLRLNGVSFTASNVAMTLALSSTNGSSYGTAIIAATTTGTGSTPVLYGFIEIDAVGDTGIAKSFISSTTQATSPSAIASTVLGGVDAVTTGVIDAIRLAGGTFDAGSVTLWGIK